MHRNFPPMDVNFQDAFGMQDYQHNKDFSNNYISYPQYNRYNNAYGSYRGGYVRSSYGPPLGFGPIGHMAPSGPPAPPFPMQGEMRWRRGYPPGEPNNLLRGLKKDKIVKYLLKCGVPREYVVTLPNDLLLMMEPMNCGLCVQKFETTDLSRIHYASKNHLKNQRKWVIHRSNSGSHTREPLKSRDLYCELCDVHITSTGHADSHYSGKPHRAIVEGRKNPRNPFLLQPNKQGRMKALIRREIKFLKKKEASSEKSKSEMKSGELYCNICKTSMMCSEQMTTHLNGKRHLTKEKQHILRLMKGEVTDDKTNTDSPKENTLEADDMEEEEFEDEDEEKGDDGEDELENEERGGGKDGGAKEQVDDDDWGEGGEDWKPSPEDY